MRKTTMLGIAGLVALSAWASKSDNIKTKLTEKLGDKHELVIKLDERDKRTDKKYYLTAEMVRNFFVKKQENNESEIENKETTEGGSDSSEKQIELMLDGGLTIGDISAADQDELADKLDIPDAMARYYASFINRVLSRENTNNHAFYQNFVNAVNVVNYFVYQGDIDSREGWLVLFRIIDADTLKKYPNLFQESQAALAKNGDLKGFYKAGNKHVWQDQGAQGMTDNDGLIQYASMGNHVPTTNSNNSSNSGNPNNTPTTGNTGTTNNKTNTNTTTGNSGTETTEEIDLSSIYGNVDLGAELEEQKEEGEKLDKIVDGQETTISTQETTKIENQKQIEALTYKKSLTDKGMSEAEADKKMRAKYPNVKFEKK